MQYNMFVLTLDLAKNGAENEHIQNLPLANVFHY